MGSYSELASDAFLLNQVGAAKSVTILGCPYCANQSIAYKNDISVIGKSSLFGLRFSSYATAQEANRIKELFERNGKTVKVKFFGLLTSPYCQLNQNDRKKVVKACEGSDAAIALSCIAGYGGIKNALPPWMNVVPGMATVGTIGSYLTVEGGKVFLDKNKTKVTRFKQANPTA
ncbi:MAG: hypothetical protein M1167_07650 [Chloroflexi bacterium]|nr:hypothetical protein [Chloroflexota bacterium]MCL5949919.1 hypothetical protein [Candidatus Bathyarchaeota archaeon]